MLWTGGTLISSYSYRGEDNEVHCETVRWKIPANIQRPTAQFRATFSEGVIGLLAMTDLGAEP